MWKYSPQILFWSLFFVLIVWALSEEFRSAHTDDRELHEALKRSMKYSAQEKHD